MEKIKNMSREEKISWTIMALNDGSDDAMRMAYDIRMSVEADDDQELKERIEYLWEVI